MDPKNERGACGGSGAAGAPAGSAGADATGTPAEADKRPEGAPEPPRPAETGPQRRGSTPPPKPPAAASLDDGPFLASRVASFIRHAGGFMLVFLLLIVVDLVVVGVLTVNVLFASDGDQSAVHRTVGPGLDAEGRPAITWTPAQKAAAKAQTLPEDAVKPALPAPGTPGAPAAPAPETQPGAGSTDPKAPLPTDEPGGIPAAPGPAISPEQLLVRSLGQANEPAREFLERTGAVTAVYGPDGLPAAAVDAQGKPTSFEGLPANASELVEAAHYGKFDGAPFYVFIHHDADGAPYFAAMSTPHSPLTRVPVLTVDGKVLSGAVAFALLLLLANVLVLFAAYVVSTGRMTRGINEISHGVVALAEGRRTHVEIRGELAPLAENVNRAGEVLARREEARRRWISGISHDIRTPLSSVLGYSERIADGAADEATRREAEVITRQTLKIRHLVEDLNIASKLESGADALKLRAFRPARLLRSAAGDYLDEDLLTPDTLALDVPGDLEPLTVTADEGLVRRALENAVNNSVAHNPDGVDVFLTLFAEGEGGSRTWGIRIADDGCGLSADKLAELAGGDDALDRLADVDALDANKHGLGLFIIKGICEAHGGTATIANRPEGGLSVELRFPLSPTA